MLMLALYAWSYLTDLSSVVYTLDYNDKVVKTDLSNNTLYEVEEYNRVSDTEYSCKIKGNEEKELEVDSGDVVYTIMLLDKDTSRVVFDDGWWYIDNKLLYDEMQVHDDEGTYSVKINDKIYLIHDDDIVYDVVMNDYDDYTMRFLDDTEVKVESIPLINVLYKEKDHFTISIKMQFEKQFTDFTINYAKSLPTSNIYYNIESGTFVQNISPDFRQVFLRNSKMLIVAMAMGVWLVLLYLAWKRTEWIYLGDKKAFILNVVSIPTLFLALICITFTALS